MVETAETEPMVLTVRMEAAEDMAAKVHMAMVEMEELEATQVTAAAQAVGVVEVMA